MRLTCSLLGLALALGCTGGVCSAGALDAALAAARPGDEVQVGSCRIEGVAAVVPAGVVLRGTDELSVLAGSAGVVSLGEGAAVSDLTIEVDGGIGVRADGAVVSLERVRLHVVHGIGAVIHGGRATMSEVVVEGEAAAETLAPGAAPSDGSYGLVFNGALAIELTDVDLHAVGPWGVIVGSSELTWTRGTLSNVVGTGIFVSGGHAALTDVSVSGALQGLQPLPPYGLVATAHAQLSTTRGGVISSEGVGVLVDQASGVFDTLAVHDARYGGVWIQDSTDVRFNEPELLRNGLAGLTSVASALDVSGGTISDSVRQLAVLGDIGGVYAGDGVAIQSPAGPHTLSGLSLSNNARIGLLADLGTSDISQLALTSLSVEGDTLGCLAQSTTGLVPSGGWDDGVTRGGATAANDSAQTMPLAIVGPIATRNVPVIDPGVLGM